MKENFNFVGKNLDIKKRESADDSINGWRKEASIGLEKEITKTPEDVILIEKAKDILNEELKSLGLKPDFDIKQEQIHILPSGDRGVIGGYSSIENQVKIFRSNNKLDLVYDVLNEFIKKILYKSKEKREREFKTLIHEFIHSHSYSKFKIIREESDDAIGTYRIGYRIDNDEGLFRGFNEAVVDKISYDSLLNYYKNLKKDSFRKKIYESWIKLDAGYLIHMKTINKIIERIAKVNHETEEEVWKRFKLGEFTGNMMHLRDVEKAYGAGALRILANMPAENNQNSFRYYEYFATNDKNARSKVERDLLSEFEKEKLNYHVDKMKDTK